MTTVAKRLEAVYDEFLDAGRLAKSSHDFNEASLLLQLASQTALLIANLEKDSKKTTLFDLVQRANKAPDIVEDTSEGDEESEQES